MHPTRRVRERHTMSATRRRSTRSSARHLTRTPKRAHAAAPVKPAARPAPQPPQQLMYRFCKAGWAVTVETAPLAQGTRFVCPFCPQSHRVPGPVRGFRKVRRAQWVKLRRVEE